MLSFASYNEVRPLLGDDVFTRSDQDRAISFDSRAQEPHLVFLGLNERHQSDFSWQIYHGRPHFALDVSANQSHEAAGIVSSVESEGRSFGGMESQRALPALEAAIYAQARALLDWNARNPFCAQCGGRTLSIQGGTKRTCPAHDSSPAAQDVQCGTRTGVSNLAFPRTDPTVIMAVVSGDGQRILLGRQKRWPKGLYSTLAGFVEPAESVEEAVRREVWEESGVVVGRVVLHSTQPWPFPANLMIGAIAQAVEETIKLQHDPELEDARWVSIDQVRQVISDSGDFTLPPHTAIANQLLQAVTDGFII